MVAFSSTTRSATPGAASPGERPETTKAPLTTSTKPPPSPGSMQTHTTSWPIPTCTPRSPNSTTATSTWTTPDLPANSPKPTLVSGFSEATCHVSDWSDTNQGAIANPDGAVWPQTLIPYPWVTSSPIAQTSPPERVHREQADNAENALTSCIPVALRDIDENDMSTLRLENCTE